MKPAAAPKLGLCMTDNKRQSAVFHACRMESASCLDVLIAHNADLNTGNHIDMTPLMLASAIGNLAIVSKLVNHGAALNARDREGPVAEGLLSGVAECCPGHRLLVATRTCNAIPGQYA